MSEHANNKKQQSKKREHNRDDGDDKDVYNDDSKRKGKNAQGIYSFFTSPPPLPQAYQEISCESLIPFLAYELNSDGIKCRFVFCFCS